MQSKFMQRLGYVFGIGLAVLMAVSLVLPALAPNNGTNPNDQTPEPTDTAGPPTFPPPMTDFSGITFDEEYLHTSGLFTVGVPTGWEVQTNVNNALQAQVNMNNSAQSSVIVAGLQSGAADVSSVDDLDAYFNDAQLQQMWSNYRSFTELGRPSTEDQLLIDFSLTDRQGRSLLGRLVSWYDENWIYQVRVVVPENARELLFHMTDIMPPEIEPLERYVDSPLGWIGQYDRVNGTMLRHPSNWSQTDGGDGQPTSYAAPNGVLMRVERVEGTTVDEAGARDYVASFGDDAEVVSVEPISRPNSEGFQVAYRTVNFEGGEESGALVLLNGAEGNLYVANVRIPEAGVDVNAPESVGAFADVPKVLDSFSILREVNLPEPTPTPTATPFPTVPPTAAPAEATAEVTAESTAETTPEADNS